MAQSPFETLSQEYDHWFDSYPAVFDAELRAVRSLLPAGVGVEVGVGSGRFAAPLCVGFGFDRALPMLEMAQKRGVQVGCGLSEALPVRTGALDYVLMVTVLCFLSKPSDTLNELKRVLRPGGRCVIAFIDRQSPLGKKYEKSQSESDFYRDAKFYAMDEVLSLLRQTDFDDFVICQTVVSPLDEIGPNEPVLAGWGQGVFVVVSARCAN